ncbi:hypothetical protein ACFL2G_03210 [Candidatus Omnitrophota bacterium]
MKKTTQEVTFFAGLFIVLGIQSSVIAAITLYNYIFKHATYLPTDALSSMLIYLFFIFLNFVSGLLHIYVGVGLLKLRKRALKILIPLCMVYLVIISISMTRWIIWFINYWRTAPFGQGVVTLVTLAIYCATFNYFKQPEIKRHFIDKVQ